MPDGNVDEMAERGAKAAARYFIGSGHDEECEHCSDPDLPAAITEQGCQRVLTFREVVSHALTALWPELGPQHDEYAAMVEELHHRIGQVEEVRALLDTFANPDSAYRQTGCAPLPPSAEALIREAIDAEASRDC